MLRDFGGPEVLTIEEAATAWIGQTRPFVGLWAVPIYLPGRGAAAFRSGYHTPRWGTGLGDVARVAQALKELGVAL